MIKNPLNFLAKSKEYVILILLLFSAIMLSVNLRLSDAVMEGIKLWAVCVLPSVFPYFFITEILSSMSLTSRLSSKLSPVMNKCFNQSGIVGYAFLMSVISGYPMGAKIVSDLKKDNLIGESESVRAAALCSTSSPMFLIASVGGLMFNNTLFGLLLLVCNFISALTVGFIFSFYRKKDKAGANCEYTPVKCDNLISDSVYNAVSSTLFVGGIITLFFVLTEMLISLKVLTPVIALVEKIFGSHAFGEGVAFGLFEYTKGLKTISGAPISLFTLPISAGLCGFGGTCVLVQSVIFLKNAKIKTAPFFIAKILGAIINFILGLILSIIFF